MESDQPDLFNLPPTRIEEVTLREWDTGPHQVLCRQLHAEASSERQAAWWAGCLAEILAYRRQKEALKGTP